MRQSWVEIAGSMTEPRPRPMSGSFARDWRRDARVGFKTSRYVKVQCAYGHIAPKAVRRTDSRYDWILAPA